MKLGFGAHSQTANHIALTAGLLAVVGVLGVVLVGVLQVQPKWVVYFSGAAAAGLMFLVVRRKEVLLWAAFILSFQFDVYLRFGGGLIVLGFPFFMAFVVAAWYVVQYRSIRLRTLNWGGPLSIPIAFLFVVFLVSTALAESQLAAIRFIAAHVQFYFIYLLARNSISTEERLDLVVRMLMIVLVMQSLVYYVQSALGITFTLTGDVIDATGRSSEAARPGGTVSTNPAGFASFILPLVCLAGASFLVERKGGAQYLKKALPLLLGLGAVALTITRAAWMSVFLGLLLIGWLGLRRGLLSKGKLLAIGALAAVTLVVAVPLMVDRLEHSSVNSAFGERSRLMQVAWEMIKANPVVGVGPGSYRFSIATYLTPELRDVWRVEVHNHYLLRTAETGLLGGVAFVLLLGVGFAQALQVARSPLPRYRAIGMGLAGGLVAVSFEMLWDIWGGFTYNALLWFLLGVIGAARDLARRQANVTAQRGAAAPKPSSR